MAFCLSLVRSLFPCLPTLPLRPPNQVRATHGSECRMPNAPLASPSRLTALCSPPRTSASSAASAFLLSFSRSFANTRQNPRISRRRISKGGRALEILLHIPLAASLHSLSRSHPACLLCHLPFAQPLPSLPMPPEPSTSDAIQLLHSRLKAAIAAAFPELGPDV